MTAGDDRRAPASEFALALLLALVERGVTDLVVSPGSRSQALALAAAELERAGRIRLHVRVDERDAGFLALGMGLATGRPAPVVTTSGSAVANLMPAALEAARDRTPMLLLTADRPSWLRGTGANQTTDQAGLLGDRAVLNLDVAPVTDADAAVAAAAAVALEALPVALEARALRRGPAQIDLQFTEPLSGPHTPIEALLPRVRRALAAGRAPLDVAPPAAVLGGPVTVDAASTLVLAGQGADADLVRRAAERGCAVIAEITSGLRRWQSELPGGYRAWLDAGAPGVRTVVATGLPTLSRQARQVALRPDLRLVTRAPLPGECFDPGHRTERVAEVRVTGRGPWTPGGRAEDAPASAAGAPIHPDDPADTADATAPSAPRPTAPTSCMPPADARGAVVDAVWAASGPADAVYLASSTMVRVADERVDPGRGGVPVLAHRGLAGIDGTVSAASGVALARVARHPDAVTRLVIGDLALAHDVGGLLVPPVEARPPLQIVVVDDRGGSIFAGLEVAQADPALYDRVVRTPQRYELTALARAYGWGHVRAHDPAELAAALATRRPLIVEVRVDDVGGWA